MLLWSCTLIDVHMPRIILCLLPVKSIDLIIIKYIIVKSMVIPSVVHFDSRSCCCCQSWIGIIYIQCNYNIKELMLWFIGLENLWNQWPKLNYQHTKELCKIFLMAAMLQYLRQVVRRLVKASSLTRCVWFIWWSKTIAQLFFIHNFESGPHNCPELHNIKV